MLHHVATRWVLEVNSGTRRAGKNTPVATSTDIGTTMAILIQAAILPLQALIRLHKSPKEERRVPSVTADGKLNIFVCTDCSSKGAGPHQRRIYCEDAAYVALVLFN